MNAIDLFRRDGHERPNKIKSLLPYLSLRAAIGGAAIRSLCDSLTLFRRYGFPRAGALGMTGKTTGIKTRLLHVHENKKGCLQIFAILRRDAVRCGHRALRPEPVVIAREAERRPRRSVPREHIGRQIVICRPKEAVREYRQDNDWLTNFL